MNRFQAFGLVHGHDPHTFGALLDDRSLVGLTAVASASSFSTKARKEEAPRSKCRAMSISLWQFASACSPLGQSAIPACARTVSSNVVIVSAIGRLLRRT
jgi:hypothetical protein